jgi:hypothetical protein
MDARTGSACSATVPSLRDESFASRIPLGLLSSSISTTPGAPDARIDVSASAIESAPRKHPESASIAWPTRTSFRRFSARSEPRKLSMKLLAGLASN